MIDTQKLLDWKNKVQFGESLNLIHQEMLVEEIERLQKTLQFYAAADSWKMDLSDVSHNNLIHIPPAHVDGGKRAREALQVENKNNPA